MIFTKKTIKNVDLRNKPVLLRADFNVPIKDGKVSDDYRIEKALPTIRDLINQDAKVVICAHLGRPNGKKDSKLSLLPVLEVLKEKLSQDVYFSDDCVSKSALQTSVNMIGGEVHLLENLRFHIEEETNDENFAKQLSKHAEVFVQDGFGIVHRKHASTSAITTYLPGIAGHLVEEEVRVLKKVAEHPKKPLGVVVGGAKIAGKIDMLENFIGKAKLIAIGGAMANTFLKALGHDMGKSLVDDDEINTAKKIISSCQNSQTQLLLPMFDLAVADELKPTAKRREVGLEDVAKDDIVLDIGQKSIESLIMNLSEMATVVWNGPLGMTEFSEFAKGSVDVAKALAKQKNYVVVGGGDTAEFVRKAGLETGFNHVSTGGGASLKILSGQNLPGVEALLDK